VVVVADIEAERLLRCGDVGANLLGRRGGGCNEECGGEDEAAKVHGFLPKVK
jgi:hypothetical protein